MAKTAREVISYMQGFMPKKHIIITEKFGKLPRVSFPAQKIENINYRINTLSGDLPNFPDRINVYKVKKKNPSIIALQTVRENLKSQGFSENEVKINDSLYQWTSNNQVVIQYNIFNDYFKINSNFLVNPSSPPEGAGAKKDRTFNASIDFLQGLGLETSDFAENESDIAYLKITNGTLTVAENQNDAQFVRVDLFQKNIDKDYKIYYPTAKNSTTYFIFKNDSSPSKIVAGKYQHLLPDDSSTYPIITAELAFEELKKGNVLVFNDIQGKDTIDITDISLGYYAGEENQQYFLPIIVFKGNAFKAYVQAISETSIGN